MEAGSAVEAAAEQGLKLLDKLTEFRFALVILLVAMALDMALAWCTNRNVLNMDWSRWTQVVVSSRGLPW